MLNRGFQHTAGRCCGHHFLSENVQVVIICDTNIKWQPHSDHHSELTHIKKHEWLLKILAAFDLSIIIGDSASSCHVEPDRTTHERDGETMGGRGIMYSTLWHTYKTFIGVTRPTWLLKWVLDIRDQCFFGSCNYPWCSVSYFLPPLLLREIFHSEPSDSHPALLQHPLTLFTSVQCWQQPSYPHQSVLWQ